MEKTAQKKEEAKNNWKKGAEHHWEGTNDYDRELRSKGVTKQGMELVSQKSFYKIS